VISTAANSPIFNLARADPHYAVDLGCVAGGAYDRHAVLDCIDQHPAVLADARCQARAADRTGLLHEALETLLLDFFRHRFGDGVGRGSRDRRILETADAIETGGIEPFEQLLEFASVSRESRR